MKFIFIYIGILLIVIPILALWDLSGGGDWPKVTALALLIGFAITSGVTMIVEVLREGKR